MVILLGKEVTRSREGTVYLAELGRVCSFLLYVKNGKSWKPFSSVKIVGEGLAAIKQAFRICKILYYLKGKERFLAMQSFSLQYGSTVAAIYQDLRVGSPVSRGDLVRQPGGHSFCGSQAKFRYWLCHEIHAIQQTLGCIVVVFQKSISLK